MCSLSMHLVRVLTYCARAGATLPVNFEYVALGNRLVNMLDAQGVQHEER